MPQIMANGIALEYESHGPANGEAILMIMALGAQLTHWPLPMIRDLVAAGYRVVTYDARDIGLSQKFEKAGCPDRNDVWQAIHAGTKPDLPYTLDDMADDAVGLLDALGIARAHLVGLSLGSWTAQMVAAAHPERVLSVTLIATNSGNPDLPRPDAEAMAVLGVRAPDAQENFEGYVDHWVNGSRILGSQTHPRPVDEIRAQAQGDFDRCYCPDGQERQLAASMTASDRRPLLSRIVAPTVVIHGAQDRLVPLAAGEDVVAHIPGAELLVLDDMGHDLPPPLYREFVRGILQATCRARVSG